VTPLHPAAVARGWQYRLRPIEDVVEREHLAVAINGTYFATASASWLRFSGDLARSMQTLISDHVIAYGLWGASLLWFDAELAPHVLQSSSAAEPVLTRAKWAVGAHVLQLHNGQVFVGWRFYGRRPHRDWNRPAKKASVLGNCRAHLATPYVAHVSRPRGQGRISARWGRLERNGDRTGQHRDSSHRIVGGRPAGGYLHRGAGAAMPQPHRVLRLNRLKELCRRDTPGSSAAAACTSTHLLADVARIAVGPAKGASMPSK
jgi:hypothetical protein